ncbi:hypothetical protein GCK32_001531 [Trichostrongylus colubriformis]|uniref:Uncharacterized protein n=1 Tax=Trichostrongylus colubriformis TaxID=6319 RepID=A0AAN8FJL9_TRICO
MERLSAFIRISECAHHYPLQSKVAFVGKVVGETDHLKRNSYYLDGLEQCNNIDREWTDSVQDDAIRHGNVDNAVWLQKAGMKEFTALFMTLPPYHMDRIARAACSKHERQLTCGAEYEGRETTMKRIATLKQIGNHKMMFEKECKDKDYVTRVYPCVGKDVGDWMRPCSEQVNAYSAVRDSVNQRISNTYDTAVDKMRVCVLRRLLEKCGAEAMKAFNTSISLGYLRTERRERLNLDFEIFNYPVHPNCIGL